MSISKIVSGGQSGVEAKVNHKPCLIIDVVTKWIDENNIKILNVAGPRESQNLGVYSLSFTFLEKLSG